MNDTTHRSEDKGKIRRVVALAGFGVSAVVLAALGGCSDLPGMESDSFLDPSVIGRWEHTPTVVPILDRIDSIEGIDQEYIEPTDPTADDLVPLAVEYSISPGDAIQIRVRDLVRVGSEEVLDRVLDQKGLVDLPKLGQVRIAGLTPSQANVAIGNAIIQAQILTRDPVVSVTLQTSRRQTFSVFGQVNAPGTYLIPESNYRLLEALTAAGGFAENVSYVYIIRQASLAEDAGGYAPQAPGNPAPPAPPGVSNPMASPSTPPAPAQPTDPTKLIDIIDELSKPTAPGKPSPGVVRGTTRPGRGQPGGAPPIDLDDAPSKREARGEPAPAQPNSTEGGKFNWMYINGEWVKAAARDGETPKGAGAAGASEAPTDLVTQRVIRVPMEPLISGNARYNLVVRPGDVIRLPGSGQGFIYMGGNINRPGSYGLPSSGRLTLTRAVDSAGGLSGLAIPERVDLTRMLTGDRQATIRLNLRAISEGTQPDIYLKSDDRINFGTNFWAYPLAILRGGFRASYGFGFLMDRNFGNDVFGVPPGSVGSGGGGGGGGGGF